MPSSALARKHGAIRHGALLAAFVAAICGCAARDSLGSRAMTIVGAGVINDPSNKSLRFDILKFGLESFCDELLKTGAPLKFGDDEPVVGRFYADSCQSQVLDDDSHKSFVVQYAGKGYAWTNVTARLAFESRGVVEYASDFQLANDSMYVYFRPRLIDGAAFKTTLVESAVARGGLAVAGVNANQLGKHIVESQLRRGFTVIRQNSSGATEFAFGIVPTGTMPFQPFVLKRTDKQLLANERSEVHSGQQDFIGPFEITDKNQALYLTLALDGAKAADVLVFPKSEADALLEHYLHEASAAGRPNPALLDDSLGPGSALYQRFVNLEPGKYYVVIDNSQALGKTAPDASGQDEAAKVDYLLLVGDRP